MILSFIFLVFVFFLLYKLIFEFVIPIYKTTKQVKKNFREMQEQMNGQQQGGGPAHTGQKSSRPTEKKTASDYIDFEEVKD